MCLRSLIGYCYELTHERYGVSCDRQHVIDVEQENRVAQDERHLKKGTVAALGRQHEAEEVQCNEKAAGDQQVDHIEGGPAPKWDLDPCQQTADSSR